jgi:NCAIR mutase (PurE)-related protein
MNRDALERLLKEVRAGALPVAAALERLSFSPATDLDFARLDHHRELRCGFPEVVFCQGKTPEQVGAIAAEMTARSERVLFTRASPEAAEAVRRAFPRAEYHARARAVTCVGDEPPAQTGLVAVITAGTADIPVAEEAAVTARLMGARTETAFDLGVAGLHRVLGEQALLREARVLIVAAGMEGALASVVGGLVDRPVIALPTSVGYGASFGGLAALLGMLNSCAPNVAVVNIDNGFGAGYLAALINSSDHG